MKTQHNTGSVNPELITSTQFYTSAEHVENSIPDQHPEPDPDDIYKICDQVITPEVVTAIYPFSYDELPTCTRTGKKYVTPVITLQHQNQKPDPKSLPVPDKPEKLRKYYPLQAEKILYVLANSKIGIRHIARHYNVSDYTWWQWLNYDIFGFGKRYVIARKAKMDFFAEEIIEIADDSSGDLGGFDKLGRPIENREFTNRSRLRIESRKWLMAKIAPEKYGDKMEFDHKHEVSHTLNIKPAQKINALSSPDKTITLDNHSQLIGSENDVSLKRDMKFLGEMQIRELVEARRKGKNIDMDVEDAEYQEIPAEPDPE